MKIAVIGLGWWGPKLLRNFINNHFVDEVVGCDSNSKQLDICRNMYGISTTTSFEDIVRDKSIDAVAIATPPSTHYDFTKQAFLSGKHVLVEKPPALNIQELEELVELSRQRHLAYMTDSTFIFSDPIQRIKELIESAYFNGITMIQFLRYGDVLRLENLDRLENAMLKNNMDAIGDLIFHDLSILLYLMKGEIEVLSVNAAYNLWDELCDTAYIDLKVGECLVHIGLSWTLPERRRDIVIFDREKFLVYNDLVPYEKLKVYSIKKKAEEVVRLPSANTEPLQTVVSHFVDCVLHHQEPLTGCDSMLDVMRTFVKIRQMNGKR